MVTWGKLAMTLQYDFEDSLEFSFQKLIETFMFSDSEKHQKAAENRSLE